MDRRACLDHLPRDRSRRLPETTRLARLLDLAWRIGNQPGRWDRAALACHYEVSERQITKDLDLLRHTFRCEIVRDAPLFRPGGYRFATPPRLDWLRAAP